MSDSTTVVVFEAERDGRIVAKDTGLEMLRSKLAQFEEREEVDYRIFQIVTTRSLLESVTLPAYVLPTMTLQEIADAAADLSYGSRSGTEWPEQYDYLTPTEKEEAKRLLWEQAGHCEDCGSFYPLDDLTYGHDGEVCSSCQSERDRYDEEEGDDDDDDQD